jgi:hypothetical protein
MTTVAPGGTPVAEFYFDALYPPPHPSPTRGEGENSLNPKQAALNAVLADWRSTTDFAGQAAHILEDGPSKSSLNRIGLRPINEQDDFWSNIGGEPVLHKIIGPGR